MPFAPEDQFTIGTEAVLSPTQMPSPSIESDDQAKAATHPELDASEVLRVRLGTLLKSETVSLLLGAGASVDCGGQLIGAVPRVIERRLLAEGVGEAQQPAVQPWLLAFYLAVRCSGGTSATPLSEIEVLGRRDKLANEQAGPLQVNFEHVLSTLHRWRSALPEAGGELRLDGPTPVKTTGAHLDACLNHATHALACACSLPTENKKGGLRTYRSLIQKLLTRPLNLKRVNVFTLNYDTLLEQAADAVGAVLLDGFVGTEQRAFRPESYEQDLYFPADTTEGRVHRFDRVLHLYKLHGSITWLSGPPAIDNPYGIRSTRFAPKTKRRLLIYPTPAKYGETLGVPYSELFRRFASAIARPQSVLFAIGYGFGDYHVNAIIRQALAVPSFTLVIVDPEPQSEFVTTLREQRDRRVWLATGPTLGKFGGFVDHALPDLRDEEIRKKVVATYAALAGGGPSLGGSAGGA